ncbi:hypothetical protein P3L51_27895, partial [Streptomyces sp. PSRA5]
MRGTAPPPPRILGHDLPGADRGAFRRVHVGTRRGGEPDRPASAGAAGTVFEIPVETVTAGGGAGDEAGDGAGD